MAAHEDVQRIARARARKTIAMIDVLCARSGPALLPEELARFTPADWAIVARLADCRPPSADTIELIVEGYARRHRIEPAASDPFAGLS